MRQKDLKFIVQKIIDHPNDPFNLDAQGVETEDLPRLVEAFNENKNIKIINLANNNIDDEGVPHLLKLEDHVTSVNLSGNNIGNAGALQLAEKGFKKIQLTQNSLKDKGVRDIAASAAVKTNVIFEDSDRPNPEISNDARKLLSDRNDEINANAEEKLLTLKKTASFLIKSLHRKNNKEDNKENTDNKLSFLLTKSPKASH